MNGIIDGNNPFIELLKMFGCDLTVTVTTWKEVVLLGMSLLFACFIIYHFFRFFGTLMCRFFKGRF